VLDIQDGLSHTVLASEKRVNSRRLGGFQPGDGYGYVAGFDGETIRSSAVHPGTDSKDINELIYDGFGSSHPSTFNAVFCDGSVKAIRYDLNPTPDLAPPNYTLWNKLTIRNDAFPINPRDYE
jgi:prepilin-type processing-associated H-X9-DG protein